MPRLSRAIREPPALDGRCKVDEAVVGAEDGHEPEPELAGLGCLGLVDEDVLDRGEQKAFE